MCGVGCGWAWDVWVGGGMFVGGECVLVGGSGEGSVCVGGGCAGGGWVGWWGMYVSLGVRVCG